MAKLPRAPARASREQLTLDVLRQFRLVYGAAHRHFREVESRCGISGAQAWVLREITLQPGIGITELAGRLAIHQSTASQLVEKLARRRYVARDSHAEDRRRVGLRATQIGQRCVRTLPKPAQGVLPNALEKLPQRALRNLHSQLQLLVAQLRPRSGKDGREHLSEM